MEQSSGDAGDAACPHDTHGRWDLPRVPGGLRAPPGMSRCSVNSLAGRMPPDLHITLEGTC